MKNSIFKNILIILLVVLLTAGIIFGGYKLFFNKINTYETIGYTELVEKIDSNEMFVLFIGSKKCSHCTTYKNTLNRVVSDYQIYVYYIDVSTLTSEEYAYINAHFPFTGTPTTLVIKDGKEYKRQICRIEGAKSYEYTVERLKKAGIIEE